MLLPFDRMKAVQAAAVVAAAEGMRISRLRLLKLLYIADRQAIKETGRPILGSKTVAMDHGPLHSHVLNTINGVLANTREWVKHFKQLGKRDIVLHKAADNSALSRYEIELLQRVSAQHEGMDDWSLSMLTHDFAEWEKNYKKGTSVNIPIEDIIDAVGRSSDKDAILSDLKDDVAFDNFFAKCAT